MLPNYDAPPPLVPTLEESRITIKRVLSKTKFGSGEEMEKWVKVYHVLYSEGLLPKSKRIIMESIKGLNLDAPPDVSPAFRSRVIAEYGQYVQKRTAAKKAARIAGSRI